MRVINDIVSVNIIPTSLENFNKLFYNSSLTVPTWANNDSLICYTTDATNSLSEGQLVSAIGYIVFDDNTQLYSWLSTSTESSIKMCQLMRVGKLNGVRRELISYSISSDYLEFYKSVINRMTVLNNTSNTFNYPERKITTEDGYIITGSEMITVEVPTGSTAVLYGVFIERDFEVILNSQTIRLKFKKDINNLWKLFNSDTAVEVDPQYITYTTKNDYFLTISFKPVRSRKFKYNIISSDEKMILL